jgi:hypothetical protein
MSCVRCDACFKIGIFVLLTTIKKDERRMAESGAGSSSYPTRLAGNYDAMHKMREMMETMKKNQAFRGEEGLKQRTAARAQRTTWRQMKGMQLAMHEINHPGNKPFVIGLGYVVVVVVEAAAVKSELRVCDANGMRACC